MTWPKRVLFGFAALAIVVAGWGAWQAWQVRNALGDIPRVPFEVSDVTAQPGQPTPTTISPDEEFEAYLLVGSDTPYINTGLPEDAEVLRSADTILLALLPTDERPPALVSIPRDLVVPSPCDGAEVKIDSLLLRCGSGSGSPSALGAAVQGLSGIPIDHFVIIGQNGFALAVDELGGVEICVDRAVGVPGSTPSGFRILLPEGCSLANGRTALTWAQLRTTVELVNGEWQAVPGDSAYARALRNRQLLLAIVEQARARRSPQDLVGLAEAMAPYLVLDNRLSVESAVQTFWSLRGLDPGSILQVDLPVESAVIGGRFEVRLLEPFQDVLARAWAKVSG